jgi:hypothetical protein
MSTANTDLSFHVVAEYTFERLSVKPSVCIEIDIIYMLVLLIFGTAGKFSN